MGIDDLQFFLHRSYCFLITGKEKMASVRLTIFLVACVAFTFVMSAVVDQSDEINTADTQLTMDAENVFMAKRMCGWMRKCTTKAKRGCGKKDAVCMYHGDCCNGICRYEDCVGMRCYN